MIKKDGGWSWLPVVKKIVTGSMPFYIGRMGFIVDEGIRIGLLLWQGTVRN